MNKGRGLRGFNCPGLAPALFVAVLLVVGPALAQGPAPGHRVFGGTRDNRTLMVDSNGAVDQVWPSAFDESFPNYLGRHGALLRAVVTKTFPIGGSTGGVQRVALDGTVLWDFRYDSSGRLSHHDVTELPNGNVLLIAWEEKTEAEAIAAGRDPSLLSGTFMPEHIVEVRQTGLTTGEIVWRWHLWDHLIQDFDPSRDNFGIVADHPELVDINYPRTLPPHGEWNHANGIHYDPVYDRITLSVNRQHEIWVIDHSTTIEEAAGHTGGRWGRGGDLLYRWGNPAAYRAGSRDDQILRTQHSPSVIPPGYPGQGHYLIFLNNAPGRSERSAIYQLVPPLDDDGAFVLGPDGVYGPKEPVWQYQAPGFYSNIMSSVQRLPNGNTLIASGTQGRVFEVDREGVTVWEYDGSPNSYFNAYYVDRWLWANRRSLSAGEGGSVTLDLIAGTAYAGMKYLVLGTRSGTEPGTEIGDLVLPLNRDAFTDYARGNPNSLLLEGSAGTLDSRGRAQAVFHLPIDSLFAVGDLVHFAYLLADPTSGEEVFVSNAVPVSIVE